MAELLFPRPIGNRFVDWLRGADPLQAICTTGRLEGDYHGRDRIAPAEKANVAAAVKTLA